MRNSFTLVTLCVATFIGLINTSLLFPVVPLYAAELGASIPQIGVIAASFSYAMASLQIPVGILSDRFGRHKFFLGAFVIFIVASLLYPMTTNAVQLAVVRALSGAGNAAILPAAMALAVDSSPREKRAEAIGWLTASFQLGLMVGPITGGFLAEHLGFDATFYSCAAISAVALAFALSRFKSLTISPHIEPSSRIEPVEANSWGWLKHTLIYMGVLTAFFIAVGAGTISTYIPLYCLSLSLTGAAAGAIITAMFGGSAIFRMSFGWLIDRFNRKHMIVGGLVLNVAAIALMAALHNLLPLILVSILFGIGMGIANPIGLAVVADMAPAKRRGLAMAINTTCYQVGFGLGPTLMGLVAGASNFETMFLACAASIAFGLLVIIGLARVRKKQ